MRTAVVSDIHGNLPALEAVIADIAARGCDRVVNLGDCLSGPLWPAETADLLIAKGWPTIAGNHERQLLAGGAMAASDAFAAARLTDRHRDWIAVLPSGLVVDDLALCHGSPANDIEHLLFSIDVGGLRAATDDEVADRSDGMRQPILFCGHSHLPAVRTLKDGRIVANPGSVGLQAFTDDRPYPYVVETGDPRAHYAIVDDGAVTLVAVDYDQAAAAAKASAEGFDAWAAWLATGCVSA